MSTIDVTTPSKDPNWESMPSARSMRKNRTDQNGASGNWLTASAQMMNASPVPEAVYARVHIKKKIIIIMIIIVNDWIE